MEMARETSKISVLFAVGCYVRTDLSNNNNNNNI